MTHRGHDDESDPSVEGETTDEIFAAGGGRRPEPAPLDEPADDDVPSGWTEDAEDTAAASPYPDDPRNRVASIPTDPARGGPGHVPPSADDPSRPHGAGPAPPFPPGGHGGPPYAGGPAYPAGAAYPAGPGHLGEQRFGRRAPRRGPQPDAHGYYPSDYYIGPDWMRVVVGGLLGAIILIGLVGGGFFLFDRYGPDGDGDVTAEATPTPLPLVPVYQCAGDAQPVTEMTAPTPVLIAGRTADSRWLAFRNPSAPPLQLWVRDTSVPDFDAQQVGIVSCASSPNEFPTPASAPRAPVLTPTPLASADQG